MNTRLLSRSGCHWRRSLSVTTYTRTSPKLTAPITLALVTDLHSTLYGPGQEILLNAIHRQNPDLVLLSGDIADHKVPPERRSDSAERAGRFLPMLLRVRKSRRMDPADAKTPFPLRPAWSPSTERKQRNAPAKGPGHPAWRRGRPPRLCPFPSQRPSFGKMGGAAETLQPQSLPRLLFHSPVPPSGADQILRGKRI